MTPIRLAVLAALSLAAPLAAKAETATLAGGCFWCVEADFESVTGVGDAVSGLTGGTTLNPRYLRSGNHIEAVRFDFDERRITYRQIVDMFLRSIDPFDAGGQFCDRGHEYTTAIFVENDRQRAIAQDAIAAAEAELGRQIVTPILDTGAFYPVDDFHQDYYKSGDRLAVTSVGVGVPKNVAYLRYRERCGRDERVREIWGDAAPFAK